MVSHEAKRAIGHTEGMKHILFPTVSAADAFVADLKATGAVRPEVGSTTLNRRAAAAPVATTTTTTTVADATAGGTAEDAAAGAAKGTGVGAVAGAAAGLLGAASVVATGGLALPVILGMTALGAGVGATVGGVGGAMGVNETDADGYHSAYEVDETYYNRVHETVNAGGRAVAVDDRIDSSIVDPLVAKHGGQYVTAEYIGAASGANVVR